MVKPEWELLSRLLLLWNGNFKSRFYENDSLLACTWNPQTTFRTWITFLLFLNILKNQRCTFKLSGLTWYVYLKQHCLKSVHIRSFSGPHFPHWTEYGHLQGKFLYSVQIRENTDEENSKHGQFLWNERKKWVYFPLGQAIWN